MRRGVFREGEKVQLTDQKGNKLTEQLVAGSIVQTAHGFLRHDDIIGQLPGSIVTTHSRPRPEEEQKRRPGQILGKNYASKRVGGWDYMCFRPRMADYQLSMPRGAQIMYPKDIASTLSYGDIRRGARVLESGGGSGAMSLALLDAVGPTGSVITLEMRDEFARVAEGNITLYFGQKPAWWDLRVTDFDSGAEQYDCAAFDRIVLDLLDPWNRLPQASRVIAPGGVLVCYVTTTTQMSRLADDLRASGQWTEPEIVELLERTWKAEGLAVRPNHEMIGHTGFLVTARRMAPGFSRLEKKAHGSKDSITPVGDVNRGDAALTHSDRNGSRDAGTAGLGEETRTISDRKLRKVLRDLDNQKRVLEKVHSYETLKTSNPQETMNSQQSPVDEDDRHADRGDYRGDHRGGEELS